MNMPSIKSFMLHLLWGIILCVAIPAAMAQEGDVPPFIPPGAPSDPMLHPEPNERPALSEHIQSWIRYAASNDLEGLVRSLPYGEYRVRAAQWDIMRFMPHPDMTAQINGALAPFASPDVVTNIEASLAHFLSETALTAALHGLTQSIMQASSGDQESAERAERAKSVGWFLQRWNQGGYLNNPTIQREAAGLIHQAYRALGVATAADVYALEYHELAQRMSASLPYIKQAASLYGFDVDRWLDSIAVVSVAEPEDGILAEAQVAIPLMGAVYTFALVYAWVPEWGRWTLGVAP